MSLTLWGALLGAVAAGGLLLVVSRVLVIRKPQLAVRVLPYVRDLPQVGRLRPAHRAHGERVGLVGVFGPFLRSAAEAVEAVLGGRRPSVADSTARASTRPSRSSASSRWCGGWSGSVPARRTPAPHARRRRRGAVVGAAVRDRLRLRRDRPRQPPVVPGQAARTADPRRVPDHRRAAVAGRGGGGGSGRGAGPVCRRSRGELSADLGRVLAAVRTGEPVALAFDDLAARGVPVVARFAQGVAVAVERGTPLADVLHAQAADVREPRGASSSRRPPARRSS